jgi:hypothetical protein
VLQYRQWNRELREVATEQENHPEKLIMCQNLAGEKTKLNMFVTLI